MREAAEGGRSKPAVADRMARIPIGGRCIVADLVPACFIRQGNTRQQQKSRDYFLPPLLPIELRRLKRNLLDPQSIFND